MGIVQMNYLRMYQVK